MHEVPMHTGGAFRQMDTAIFRTLPEVPENMWFGAKKFLLAFRLQPAR